MPQAEKIEPEPNADVLKPTLGWDPNRQCHDCAGPCYGDTTRCAYHGIRHGWEMKGVKLRNGLSGVWSDPLKRPRVRGIAKLPAIKLNK